MAMLGVGAATEQGYGAFAAELPDFLEWSARSRTREAGQVAPAVLGPGDRSRADGAEQGQHGAELLEPAIHAALADTARPETHDEHPGAVLGRGAIVDALSGDAPGHVSIAAARDTRPMSGVGRPR